MAYINTDIPIFSAYLDTREHRILHCQLEELAYEFVKRGVIKFDKKTKKYYIVS